MEKKKSVWQILMFSGIIGVVSYTIHVVLGGILWKDYSHITQTVSELTGNSAPNAGLLKIFTNVYGFLLVIFSISLYFVLKQFQIHKVAKIGAVLLIIMEVTSFLGYYFFPLDTSMDLGGFQNVMHMVVTAVVVLCTLGSCYFIAVGLLKSSATKKLGIFILVCAVIITISGMLTPIVMANNIMISGLTERINIFTLHIATIGLAVAFFVKK